MFNRGDIVRLKSGHQPIIVTSSLTWEIDGYYLSSSCLHMGYRDVRDFILFDRELEDSHFMNWKWLRREYSEIPSVRKTKTMTNRFKIKDRICFRSGYKPLIVTKVNGKHVYAYYENNPQRTVVRCHTNFKLIETPRQSQQTSRVVNGQNYETIHGPATLIGHRRDGAFVVETFDGPRGRSSVVAITSIGPRIYDYTVRLQNIADKYTFHRRAKKGSVDLHDVIKRDNGKLYRVIALDTQNSVSIPLVGEKLIGQKI